MRQSTRIGLEMGSMSFEVQDCNGSKLKVGDKVLYGDPYPEDRDNQTGKIIEITDPDGDYDDELERAVEIRPYVIVEFGNLDREKCHTYNDTPVGWNDYPDGPSHYIYQAEDLELIVP